MNKITLEEDADPSKNLFKNSVIVCAHPDDEILWFSSILEKVDFTIICYLHSKSNSLWGIGREKSLSEHPIKQKLCLNINESCVFDEINWANPKHSDYGMLISDVIPDKKKYISNYKKIKNTLKKKIAAYSTVFTHSPWGEYGHEEHVQLFVILKQLRDELGFNLWFPNYFSNKSSSLMFESFPCIGNTYFTLNTNIDLGESVKEIYKKHNCWTWYDAWKWMKSESFFLYEEPSGSDQKYGISLPLNAMRVEPYITPKPPSKSRLQTATSFIAKLFNPYRRR